MSRSNNTVVYNPSQRWFEWNGEKGHIKYYDKEAKQNVEVKLPFGFILLDQLAKITGFSGDDEIPIYSNEVRSTQNEVLVVRSNRTTLAQGHYADIRNNVKAQGGHYTASLYIAYKDGDDLKIGNLSLRGAALRSWMDFSRNFREEIYKKALIIDGSEEGKKGSIVYRIPTFLLRDISEESDKQVIGLHKELRAYLNARSDQYEQPEVNVSDGPAISDGAPIAVTAQQAPHPADAGENLYGKVNKPRSEPEPIDWSADAEDDLPF